MGSNYPPGVTGNEPEIAGYPPCGRTGCGHPADDHLPIEDSGACQASHSTPTPDCPIQDPFCGVCEDQVCACPTYLQHGEEPDWLGPAELDAEAPVVRSGGAGPDQGE